MQKQMQGHRCWKGSFSVRESCLCNLKSKAQYMKDVSFLWNEMLFAMQKTDIHVLELFCRASHARASRHRITSLKLLRTLMLCLMQLSKCKATDAEKLLSQWEKLLNAILIVKLKCMKDVSFSWNEMLFAMQKTDFQVLELFLQSKSC